MFSEVEKPIQISQGVLDLRSYSELPNITLNGEWEFVYGEFLLPGEDRKVESYLSMPSSWQDKQYKGQKLQRTGFASFRIKILFSKALMDKELRIQVGDIASAYRLYLDKTYMGGQGRPTDNPLTDESKIKISTFSYTPNKEEVIMLFHISNYTNNFGGFWDMPILGRPESIEKEKITKIARELFLLGSLLIMAFYHFGLYFFRRKEKAIVFFALFCLLLGIRISITGFRFILELMPEIPWDFAFRIEFFSYYWAVPAYLMFVHHLFQEDSKKKLVQYLAWACIAYSVTIIFPISVFTSLLTGFQLLNCGIVFYAVYLNFNAILKNRDNAGLFFLGILILSLSVFIDILQNTLNERPLNLTPYALLAFIFLQALVLSNRIAKAFKNAEDLSLSLRISNDSLTTLKENLELIVYERTNELNKTVERLRKDMLLASRIQQKIVPPVSRFLPQVTWQVYFVPKDEVGGDLYDAFEMEDERVRFFVADATGHGIQAALYTMAIKSEYESMKRFHPKPNDLLQHLNSKIQNKFQGLRIYFSCIVVDLDPKNESLSYCSAGHPDQYAFPETQIDPIVLRRTGNIIGLQKEQEYGLGKASWKRGDRLYLFTDGILEQKNSKREEYGTQKLIQVILQKRSALLSESVQACIEDLKEHRGTVELEDDCTLLGAEFLLSKP